MTARRKYEDTHPWMTFTLDLQHAPPKLWVLLGEARSKCEHIAGVPLQPELQREFHMIYLAKGVRATTAIEGNTLTENEVRQQIDGKLDVPESKEYLKQEIANIIDACNLIQRHALQSGKTPITVDDLLEYHKLILKNLACESHVVLGGFRTASVTVGNYLGAPAEDCEYLTGKLCDWLEQNDQIPPPLDAISFGILKAVLAHIYLAWIHPFGDGNGRLARLVEFRLLLESGIPTPACHLLSDHYNSTRMEYYRQLDAASKSKGNIIPFIIYALVGLVDGLQEQITRIKDQQYTVSWVNYVHEMMSKHNNVTGKRSRDLVLALSLQNEPVPARDMMTFNPRVAETYRGKTRRTLGRDLNLLLKENLIRPIKGGWIANKQIILAFLPDRSQNAPPNEQDKKKNLANP